MERQEYYKIINGVVVRSYCTSLYIDGHWVSNPTSEMIAQEGWLPYTPPAPEPFVPTPQNEPYESSILNAVKTMFADQVRDMTDEQALSVAALFPTWHSMLNAEKPQRPGKHVDVGDRLWDDGELWKVITAHDVLANWRPKDSPSLFVKVSIAEWPEIPENIPAENAWMQGDKGTWHGQHYISLIDNNVWNPDQYPAAWELVP